jgi:hypothetical protein
MAFLRIEGISPLCCNWSTRSPCTPLSEHGEGPGLSPGASYRCGCFPVARAEIHSEEEKVRCPVSPFWVSRTSAPAACSRVSTQFAPVEL